VTDAYTIRVVDKTLSEVNRRLVEQVEYLNGKAVGITPKDKVVAAGAA